MRKTILTACKDGDPLQNQPTYNLFCFQLAASDVITFHNYCPADSLERQIAELKILGRPLICTEWMARTCGSLVNTNLPVFAQEKVGCLNTNGMPYDQDEIELFKQYTGCLVHVPLSP